MTHTDSNQRMKILGITGGVGAGKSTILTYLQHAYGAVVIQCDEEARKLQLPGGACYEELLALLRRADPNGHWLLPDGELDRGRMAQLFFREKRWREEADALIHPAVKSAVWEKIALAREDDTVPFVTVEAALLLEDRYDLICDEIWYIYVSKEIRYQRLELSRGYSREKADAIMAAQQSDEVFRKACALTIDNSSENVQNTYDQIDEGLRIHGFLQHSKRQQR